MAEQLAPGAVFGRDFRVVQRIAAGGMGTVYEAIQLSTGKRRALKIMHAQYEGDERTRARFIQEAQATAAVESDHIVEMVAAGVEEDTNTPWIAMELLQGRDMKSALAERGAFAPAEVAEMFRQLCHGLGAAHREGLVHRDLKPENIFLAHPRREGIPFTVKLLDFGLAKLVQSSATHGSSTQAVGSPRWMAPEQAGIDGQIAPQTDVWALGLIAFNMLTGRVYWRIANSDHATIMQQLTEVLMQPLDPASVRAAELGVDHLLPPGFDGWFARCVVREAELRFRDADEALPELLPLLDPASMRLSRMSARPVFDLGAPLPRDEEPFTLDASVGPTSFGTEPSAPPPPPPGAPLFSGQIGYVVVGALVSAMVVFAVAMGLRKAPTQPLPASLPSTDLPVVAAIRDAGSPTTTDAGASAPTTPVADTADVPEAPPVVFAPETPSTATTPPNAVRPPAGTHPAGNGHAEPAVATEPANATDFNERMDAQIREHRVDIEACYERGTESVPNVHGQLTIFFVVGPDGHASEVSTRGLGEAPAVGDCVATMVRGMTFHAPPPSPMTMVYQWTFRRARPEAPTAPASPVPATDPPTAPPSAPSPAPAG